MATMPSGFAKLGCREWAGRSITIVPRCWSTPEWTAASSGVATFGEYNPHILKLFWYVLVSSKVIITMLLLVHWDVLAIHIPKIGRGRGFRLQSTGEQVGWVMFEHTTSTDLVSIGETHAARWYTAQVRKSPYDDMCSQTRGWLNGLVIK